MWISWVLGAVGDAESGHHGVEDANFRSMYVFIPVNDFPDTSIQPLWTLPLLVFSLLSGLLLADEFEAPTYSTMATFRRAGFSPESRLTSSHIFTHFSRVKSHAVTECARNPQVQSRQRTAAREACRPFHCRFIHRKIFGFNENFACSHLESTIAILLIVI